VRSVSRIERIG